MINVKNYVDYCDTADDGSIIYDQLLSALKSHKLVTISFDGRPSVTSSFVNVAFVQLLNTMHIDDIKRHIRFVSCSPQVASMIKNRLTEESEKHVAA